jgi:diguanylate cyclase (GGDEF)-like protein/PAS domain S-box-containing protein
MSSKSNMVWAPAAVGSAPSRGPIEPATHRRESIRVLFLLADRSKLLSCAEELRKVYSVRSGVSATPEEFGRGLASGSYDIGIADYHVTCYNEYSYIESLGMMPPQVPVIFLVRPRARDMAAELPLEGAADWVEMDCLSHLPMAVRRALNEKGLRHERDRAERALRQAEAHYRALSANPTYGICSCSPEGKFLDVNQALLNMLGYPSKEELLAMDIASRIVGDPAKREQLLGHATAEGAAEPVEVEWKRKDGAVLKVRLSAQEVNDENGESGGYEVIAEDVTKQRELEDRLRRQAASDPLTGLANYRHLIDALDMEIRRSNRTGRGFSLVMFDMDGLKQINDHYGHLIGSQALCRMADALTVSCRDIDTAARYGGDEFALLLPETGPEAAHAVARRIRINIAEDGNGPPLSVSAGVGVYPADGDNVNSILHAADAAMYRMKWQGKVSSSGTD